MADNNPTNLPAVLDPQAEDIDLDALAAKLTTKQRAWLAQFVGAAHFSARKAAIRAGYADPANSGMDNRRNPDIIRYVQAFMHARGLSPEEVLAVASDMATASLDDAIEIDDDGRWYVSVGKARQNERMHTIKTLKRRTRRRGTGDRLEVDTEEEVTMHDPYPAIHDILTIHKLFPERNPTSVTAVQVNLNDPAAVHMTDEQIVEKLRAWAGEYGYRLVKIEDAETNETIDSTLKDD